VTPSANPDRAVAVGLGFAVATYGLWGLLPIFFRALAPVGAVEIVAWRILLSLAFCAILLTVVRGWRALVAVARDRRLLLTMGAAGALILVNWLVYVWSTLNGHVVEAALGYFVNPIVTVLLGVLVLRESLRPLQWAAVSLSGAAVVVLAVNYGQFPWVALALAVSFGIYGLIKKHVGDRVDAVSGLTLETAWLAPIAGITIGILAANGHMVTGTQGAFHTAMILSAGVVTAVPLLFFAAAARRIPLVYLGLTQYIAPVLQFILGVTLFAEDMPAARWLGFALLWVALIVLTIDMVGRARVAQPA
jgi:chloramphenicol-sensitive protein RarD